jgi:hypothetical protein
LTSCFSATVIAAEASGGGGGPEDTDVAAVETVDPADVLREEEAVAIEVGLADRVGGR